MHLWKDYNLPFYFRPYFNQHLPEYDIIKTDEGFKMRVSNTVRRRVFIEDVPSLMNLDPYTKRAMIGVEVEKAEALREAAKKAGAVGGGDKTVDQALLEYEHDG